ncbi:MAG: hypothetical protein KatS3mg051_1364 [Anaerolineae bacterium]|nr:MAG: hypothetical protein KatS3mg051_1364 [Anaerolineae bacterium]
MLNLFNRAIDFAFAFVMLRILGPANAGIYYYAIVIFGWFDILTNFGLNTLLTREVARDRSTAGRYLFNSTALRLALAALGIPLLLGFLAVRQATVSPALEGQAIAAIVLLYIGLLPGSISTGLTALFYAFEKAEYPAAITTVSTIVKVTLGLGTLLLGWGVVGLAGGAVITNVVTLLVLGWLARPLAHGVFAERLDPSLLRLMVGESWPLMINHLLATVFFKIDIVLMEAINGNTVVGQYSTAYKWLDALNIIPAFLTMALLPVMARQAREDRAALRRNYALAVKLLVMVALPVAVITTFIAEPLIRVLGGAEYLPAGGIALQIMIWSIPIGWINSVTNYVIVALDRQRTLMFAFAAGVIFNVITNLLLLPAYSYRAAASDYHFLRRRALRRVLPDHPPGTGRDALEAHPVASGAGSAGSAGGDAGPVAGRATGRAGARAAGVRRGAGVAAPLRAGGMGAHCSPGAGPRAALVGTA